MDDPNINAAFLQEENMLPVDEWILERYENCIRIANTKPEKADVIGWLQDAEYFRRILVELKCLSSFRAKKHDTKSSVPQPSAGQPSDWIVACEELRPENHELGGSYKVTMHSGKVWHTTEKPPSAGQTEGKLEKICKAFIREQTIRSSESVWQCDWISEHALELVQSICDVIGYFDDELSDIAPSAASEGESNGECGYTMKSTNSAEPDIIEMSRMYRFERDQRIILEKQIAALTFESITVPFSERFEQFIEALPSCQMRSNLRWIQSNFCKTHQEVISMSNGACPYCEAAAPAQPQHKITPCMKCEDDFGAAPSPVLQAIERGARELFRIGNERIGERKWEDVAEHYLAESAACLRAAAQSEYQAARASSPAVVPTSQNRCPNEEIAKRDELLGEWCDSWNDLTLRDRRDSIQDALFDKTNAIWPTAWPPIEESCKRCNSAYGRGMEKAADATNEYLDRNGATPANGRGLYLRLDELLKLAVPAVAPKCPNCESTDPLTPGILTCGHEFHTPAVARRTQGDWKVGHDGPSRPIIEHGMRMFSVNEFKNGKWGSFEDEERLSQTIVDALNLAALRESVREAHSDDLIEALKTIADAPTHITYEGIFVSTNVKDVARKALRAERNEASPEAQEKSVKPESGA